MDQDTVLNTIHDFKNALKSMDIKVDNLILFGSYSVNRASEESDIDLVVISNSFANKSYWERIDILSEAVFKVFAPIEPIAMTPGEWKSKKSLIVDYAKNGIWIK